LRTLNSLDNVPDYTGNPLRHFGWLVRPGRVVETLALADSLLKDWGKTRETLEQSGLVPKPGRPKCVCLDDLEFNVFNGFLLHRIRPTKTRDGTFARALEYVYDQIELPDRDAHRQSRTLCDTYAESVNRLQDARYERYA
jgi:hypothetical protein